MSGKTCLITGSTAGIGRATALSLARAGATVIITGRSPERTRLAAAEITQQAGPSARVEPLHADLSSQAEVRRLAAQVLDGFPRLDVLINNAGAIFATRRQSIDGVEMTLALNHLAPILLTSLLLDRLIASAPARIITVSSEAHRDVRAFDFDDPQAATGAGGRRPYPRSEAASLFYTLALPWAHPGFIQYAHTKLANLLFTFELARRLERTGVTANALDPGLVATDFARGNGSYGWFMHQWTRLRGISAAEGAESSVRLASSPEFASVTGRYFVKGREARPSAAAKDPDAARRLWTLSEQMTGTHTSTLR